MEFNINQSIHNEDNNENQKLLLKEIDESIFSSSIHKKRFGLLELHITVEKIYSHYDFEKIFRDLYLKTRGIKSIEIDENYYKAFIIFNPKKISLKEILENIIYLGYTPSSIKYKERKRTRNYYGGGLFDDIYNVLSSFGSIFVSIGNVIADILFIFKR
mgnify:CR=1 FL=1